MTEPDVRAGKVNWIAKGSDVGVQERTLAPGQVIPWHYHTIITETAFCIEGTVQIEMLGPPDTQRLAHIHLWLLYARVISTVIQFSAAAPATVKPAAPGLRATRN